MEDQVKTALTPTGFSQGYNSQVLTDQASLLIVGYSVSNAPVDVGEIGPALDAVPAPLEIAAVAYDTGYWRSQCDRVGAAGDRPLYWPRMSKRDTRGKVSRSVAVILGHYWCKKCQFGYGNRYLTEFGRSADCRSCLPM